MVNLALHDDVRLVWPRRVQLHALWRCCSCARCDVVTDATEIVLRLQMPRLTNFNVYVVLVLKRASSFTEMMSLNKLHRNSHTIVCVPSKGADSCEFVCPRPCVNTCRWARCVTHRKECSLVHFGRVSASPCITAVGFWWFLWQAGAEELTTFRGPPHLDAFRLTLTSCIVITVRRIFLYRVTTNKMLQLCLAHDRAVPYYF